MCQGKSNFYYYLTPFSQEVGDVMGRSRRASFRDGSVETKKDNEQKQGLEEEKEVRDQPS
jgi:hypothetical protein